MFDITSSPGDAGHGSFGFSERSKNYRHGRCRVRSDDFGLPERAGLLDLARTYLEVQARLWTELVGTPAVPAADATTIGAMADDFERRFRQQRTEFFRPDGTLKLWIDLALAKTLVERRPDRPRGGRVDATGCRIDRLRGKERHRHRSTVQ
ncbi:MAG: hypothetical protein WCR51_03980 [Planctomycetia bacterium]